MFFVLTWVFLLAVLSGSRRAPALRSPKEVQSSRESAPKEPSSFHAPSGVRGTPKHPTSPLKQWPKQFIQAFPHLTITYHNPTLTFKIKYLEIGVHTRKCRAEEPPRSRSSKPADELDSVCRELGVHGRLRRARAECLSCCLRPWPLVLLPRLFFRTGCSFSFGCRTLLRMMCTSIRSVFNGTLPE